MVPMVTASAPLYYRRNADELGIAGTDRPWLYSSGCSGTLRAELDLVPNRWAAVPPCDQPPQLNGRLDDPCWDGEAKPVVLVSRRPAPQSAVQASAP
jgi:hypothetical protein